MKLARFFLIMLLCFVTAADAKPRKRAVSYGKPVYSAIVIDAHTGKILFNEGADNLTYPASLTKMMTLYLLFEAIEKGKISPQARLKVSQNAARQTPMKLHVRPGDTIAVRDALLAIMTRSANDVSVVVAESIAGSEEKFAQMMTAKARALGMKNTTFRNASGLPNPEQRTTARDMATLSLALYKHYPRYYSFFRTKNFVYKGQNIHNHNHLLGAVPGVDGIKTGWIYASGWNLAASAARSGQRVIAVVLGGRTRLWRDKRVADLLDYGFNKLGVRHESSVPLPVTRPAMAYQADSEPVVVLRPEKTGKRMKDVKPAAPEKPVAGHWAVQVGAFKSSKRARDAATTVKKQVPALSDAKVVISPIKHTRGKLYQTRLVNLTEATARKSCRQAVKKGHACTPIAMKK